MKLCFKCRAVKPLSEFYRHPQMRDGHLNKCKDCTKKDANTNRDARREYYREYDRLRYSTDESRKMATRAQAESWRLRNMDGKRAQVAVSRAINAGILQRKPCSVCGRLDSHGHHPDYAKPLEVMWLCPIHHAEQHQREGRMSPGEAWKPEDNPGTGTKAFGARPKSKAA